jgi:glutathione S-transferase
MERVERTLSQDIPPALDYLEGELPADGFLFGDIGLADISLASFFVNAGYAGFSVDGARWPRTGRFVAAVLGHPVLEKLLAFEAIQLSADIKGRRQALLDAGAPLTSETFGTRAPRKGLMRL